MGDPVDTSGLFGSFGGVSGEVTGDSLFMGEENRPSSWTSESTSLKV